MNTPALTAGPVERTSLRFGRFLSSGRFAMFALCVLLCYDILIAMLTFVPINGGALGRFAEEFRIRCFQLQPGTGSMNWSSVIVMLAEPMPLAGIILFFWRDQVRDLWRSDRRSLFPLSASAVLLVALIGVGLAGLGRTEPARQEFPFPGDRLRSALPMPTFRFADQDGRFISPDDFQGRVVLVTAVYSTCTTACPMMLKQIREVIDQLTPAERAELSVLAFSLKPEVDTSELRTMITRAYGFDAAGFHFVNGSARDVNELLDQLGIGRERDRNTGEVIHSNLFLLLDRKGRISYRLSASPRERSWLGAAVRTLLAESAR